MPVFEFLKNLRSPAAWICATVLALGLAATPGSAQSRYGSIVFSQESGSGYAWGMAWSYNSRSSARSRAIAECRSRGGTRCGEIAWFRDACGALAIGDRNGYGTGWANTYGGASAQAMNGCRRYNRNCRPVITRCAR